MNAKKSWAPPGWPWELEVLSLIFLVVAVSVPFYLQYMEAGQTASQTSLIERAARTENPGATMLKEQTGFLWAVGIVALYIVHLFIAASGFELLSTPFSHLLAPLTFAMIAYYRLFDLTQGSNKFTAIVTGSPSQIAAWAGGVIIITLLLARVRMARYLMSFRHVKWDISSPTHVDKSYFELMAQLRPLIYAPRIYRACEQGILIEGWFYVMPIAFELVQSIGAVSRAAIATSGHYLATSSHNLIRLELLNNSLPIFISPKDRDHFLKYCAQHVIRSHRGGTTHSGAEPKARQTSSGIGKV